MPGATRWRRASARFASAATAIASPASDSAATAPGRLDDVRAARRVRPRRRDDMDALLGGARARYHPYGVVCGFGYRGGRTTR